jgi:hypothetical protein
MLTFYDPFLGCFVILDLVSRRIFLAAPMMFLLEL